MSANVYIAQSPVLQFLNNAGLLNSGGSLLTQVGGVNYPTYQDPAGNIPLPNPIPLNSRGEISNASGVSCQLFLLGGVDYTFTLFDLFGNQLWTANQVTSLAPVAVGSMNNEKGSGGQVGFVNGVDFTAGTSTTLTLSQTYGSSSNLWVNFDGAEQGGDTFSLNGETLTFNAPIPVGTNKVYVKGGTALSIGTPGLGTIITASLASGSQLFNRVFDLKSAKDYGCTGNGTTDDTAALAAFFSALQSGGYGFLPDGTYKISNGFVVSSTITLFGSQNAVINNTNASLTIPIIHILASAAQFTTLEGLSINSVAVGGAPAVAGVQVDAGGEYVLRNLNIRGTQRGIFIEGASTGAVIDGCYVSGTTSDGFNIIDGNLSISDCYAIDCTGVGFHFTTTAGSAGITMDNCTAFNNAGGNYSFQGTSGAIIQDVFLSNCVASASPNNPNYLFDTFGKNLQLTGCFSELGGANSVGTPVSAAPGFHFTANNHRVTLTGCQSTGCGGPGLTMECSYFSISGGDYTANGTLNYGAYAGVSIGPAGAVANFAITGINTIPAPVLDNNSQGWGIAFGVSGNSVGTITGNALSGTVAPISIPSPSSLIVADNAGFINEASGTGTITSGTQTVSILHGMSVTPSFAVASIINATGGANLELAVGTPNSSGFTVFMSATSGSNVNIAWYARQ
jgi:hypothetical protein